MKKTIISGVLVVKLLLVALLLTGCSGTDPYSPYAGSFQEYETTLQTPDLQQFQSLDDYQNMVRVTDSSSADGLLSRGAELLDGVVASTELKGGAMPETTALPNQDLDYSKTNNQVSGVDEADLLKTDGEYIYTLTGKTIFIVSAYPAENASLLSRISFEDYQPQTMFIAEDKLVVFGTFNDNDFYDELGFRPRNGMTFVNIYDVSDRENPTLDKEFKFEGRYFDARLIDDDFYVVLRASPENRETYPTPIIVNGEVAKSMPLDDMFFRPMPYNYPELVTTHAISLGDYATDSVAVMTESLQTVYMSEENLYLVGRQYISEWELREEVIRDVIYANLTTADKALIEKIKNTDNDVLSQREKEQKIMQVYYSFIDAMSATQQDALQDVIDTNLASRLEEIEYFEYSLIDKIKADNEKLSIVAQGKVPGQLSNQFSLDEHDDYLRVATTINPVWSSVIKDRTESTNNVWTMDSELDLVGELTGLAEGERIYATRFVGERLYMVTFRQVDPFFVIDLSNPEKPESLGELKIPGFSRYLHPYDENHIIGIGRDATAMGQTQGLKISLFDVTDVTKPQEVAQFVTKENYAQSTAEYEHKAFLFSKKKNLLVIPAYSYNYRDEGETYNGALVFNISTEEIKLRGLIDHSGSLSSNYYYRAGVQRSLFIEDMLYTKSPNLLRINSLATLVGVNDIDLKQPSDMNIY